MTSPEQIGGAESLAGFHQEMALLKAQEAEARQTVHFAEIEVTDLTEADALMWQKVKAILSGEAQFDRKEFAHYRGEAGSSSVKSRRAFVAFLANKLM